MTSPKTNRAQRVPQPQVRAQCAASSRDAGLTGGTLHVSVRPEDDSDVVVLAGEIDVATAPELRSAIHMLLDAGRNHITVDLDAVTLLDAAAIEALISATCAVALTGGSLRVTANSQFMMLLRLTRETDGVGVSTPLTTPVMRP